MYVHVIKKCGTLLNAEHIKIQLKNHHCSVSKEFREKAVLRNSSLD